MTREEWQAARREWVAARKRLEVPAKYADQYVTLCQAGLRGCWVSPPQITSDSHDGPVLVANHFLDAETVRERRDAILRYGGYLPELDFNRTLDLALWLAGMHRRDIYITQALHLLPNGARRKHPPKGLLRQSFETVTQLELCGRTVVTLGGPAKDMCFEWLRRNDDFRLSACLPHPSGSGPEQELVAYRLARALCEADRRKWRKRNGKGQQSFRQGVCAPARKSV